MIAAAILLLSAQAVAEAKIEMAERYRGEQIDAVVIAPVNGELAPRAEPAMIHPEGLVLTERVRFKMLRHPKFTSLRSPKFISLRSPKFMMLRSPKFKIAE